MASAEQSSNSRVIRVNRKFTRNPIMMRLHTRNNIKPLRMTAVEVLVQNEEKGEEEELTRPPQEEGKGYLRLKRGDKA